MSQSSFLPHHASVKEASSSTHPQQAISASYHPLPRPRPLPPLEHVDTQAVKQELHDALGENGLPYWKAMNGYLLGQVGKVELEGMVRSWLPKERLYLHNKLLVSILTNASASRQPPPSAIAIAAKKRKRVAPDHPDFDVDEVSIEQKARVALWTSTLTTKDRNRLKRLMAGRGPGGQGALQSAASGRGDGDKDKDAPGSAVEANGEVDAAGQEWIAAQRKSSCFTPRSFLAAPLSTDRSLPSASQLSQRLSTLAPSYGLSISPEASQEIGEFLAVGMDAHLVDILHGVVNLTGTGRSNGDGIEIRRIERIDERAELPEEMHGKRRSTGMSALANGVSTDDVDRADSRATVKANGTDKSPVNGKRKWGSMRSGGASSARPPANGHTSEDVDMDAAETDGPIRPLFQSPEQLKASLRKSAPDADSDTKVADDHHDESPTPPRKTRSHSRAEADNLGSLPKKTKTSHLQPVSATCSLPKPTVDTLQHLFAISPSLHAQASPALYKLAASQYQAESSGRRGLPTKLANGEEGIDAIMDGQHVSGRTRARVAVNGARPSANGSLPRIDNVETGKSQANGSAAPIPARRQSEAPSLTQLHRLNGPQRGEMFSKSLLESGLLQPEKQPEEGKKRSYHWKYEDPALILRDVLG